MKDIKIMKNKITKNDWVSMFTEIGLSENQMRRWHQVFESRHPESHKAFLEWLGIDTEEITRIRAKSN